MRIYQFFATVLIIALAQFVTAQNNEVPTQVTDQNRTGDLPFSSSIGTNIEHVDLLTGGLSISIPIYKVPDRGFDNKLLYHWDSNYFLESMRLDGLGQPFWIWTTEINAFWQVNQPLGVQSTPFRIQCTDYQGEGWFQGYDAMIYWDDSGAQHAVAAQNEAGNCAGFTGNSSGPDLTGKGMWATASYNIANVLLSNGEVEDTKDTNGNLSNALGRTICTGSGTQTQTVYTCLDSNGNPQIYTLNWQTITINTSFNRTGITEIVGFQVSVISSIVLPNAQQYVFKYDAFGDVTEIDLPTGGAVTYTWAIVSPVADTYKQTRRAVASRTEWLNGVTNGGVCQSGSSSCSTWQLSFAVSGNIYTTTVTYPAVGTPAVQNQSVLVGSTGAITDAKVYAGSATGTPIREYQMGYATDADPTNDDLCWNPNGLNILKPMPQPVGQRLTSITTILEDGTTQAQKQFDYETFTYTYYPNHCSGHYENATSKQYTTSRGNVTEIREYDWGVGAHGALIRRTDKTYLHNSNSTYLTYNIVNKVLQTTVYDSTSNTCQGLGQACSQTQYEYDNYVPNALISTSGTAPGHDYTNYSSSFIYRGNVTRVMRWPNTTGSPLTSLYTYDDLGNIRAVQDTLGNATTYSYLDSWSGSSCPVLSGHNGQAFVTKITDALGHQINRTYYQCSSLLEAHLDQNDITAGRTGALNSYDWAGRVTQTQDTHLTSDGSWGKTTNTYNDVPPITISSSTTITTSLNKTSVATKDGLGRVIESQLTSDPDGTTEIDTTYDALSRKSTVTSPHRATASSTDGTTTYTYDALSRITAVAEPDGSQVLTSFSTNCTTAIDEAGKKRESCSDGLGRMTGVWEAPSTLNYETDYSYDVLGNLKSVNQKGSNSTKARIRTFMYDAMSRLTSATNPESGTISYSYNLPGGSLCAGDTSAACSKTAPSPNQPSTGTATVTTTYTYDTVNRLTKKSYADTYPNNIATPDEVVGYDGVALSGCTTAPPTLTDSNPIYHRTAMCDGSGATSWSHDQVARVSSEKRTIKGLTNQTKQTSYTYNLDDSLLQLTYPGTGKVILYSVGGAGRPTAAQDVAGSINYVQNATYAAFGGLTGMVNGVATGFNGINTADSYNDRLQPLQLYVTTATITSATLTQLQSSPCPTVAATIMSRSYNFSVGGSDNGNVRSITNCLDTTRSQSFTYDNLNRIVTGQSSGTGSTSWGEQYTIDAWGNLTNIGPVTGKSNHEPLSCAGGTNNQLNTCYNYDPAGNVTKNGTITYIYDAANRLAWSMNGYQYFYDGDGSRVVKCTSASQGSSCPTGSTGTLYWRFSGGDTIEETNLAGTSQEEYIFFGGKRVARRDVSTNAVHYYFPDHLGSASAVTNANGSSLDENLDYYPYGGLAPTSTDNVPQNYKFTGKERDSESGLDEFGARYYASSFGRFMTPDWAARATAVPYAVFGDPQSLNLYGYVRNDPVSRIDADGHGGADIPSRYVGHTGSYSDSDMGDTDPSDVSIETVLQAQGNALAALLVATGNAGFGAQNQSQTKQLTADDVSKGIKAYDSDKGGKQPGRVVEALDAMGTNFTATGDVVRAGVKQSGVELPKDADKVLANVNSISRTGDNVVITNEKSMTIKKGFGQLSQTISFTINESVKGKSGYQGPALQNLKGIGIGLGPLAYHPDHWGPE